MNEVLSQHACDINFWFSFSSVSFIKSENPEQGSKLEIPAKFLNFKDEKSEKVGDISEEVIIS